MRGTTLAGLALAAAAAAVLALPSASPSQEGGAAPPQWKPGLVLSSGDSDSTDSLQIVLGAEPGLYELRDVGAAIQLRVLPATAENTKELTLEEFSAEAHKLRSNRVPEVTIDFRRFNDDAFVFEASSTGASRPALFTAVVRGLDNATTPTIINMPLELKVLLEGPDRVRIIQFEGEGARKTARPESSVLVAPVAPDKPARVYVTRRELPLATPK
ncbi:MAG: hypothetical protein SF028_10750 [Candidatus Sumerlaeia bacterium]|nr:hypothetical protein [Candidatus Sumerlaeia bacterium]